MKYFFIVNPAAGTRSAEETLRGALTPYEGKIDYRVYVSAGPEDTERYLKGLREKEQGTLRLIACGGDGTLNMVVNSARGMKDVQVGCYACGSGNDYVKYYGKVENFLDLEKLFSARVEEVDLMSVGGRLAINMVHFGFDTNVVRRMEYLRRLPLIGGTRAYFSGVLCALLSPMFTACELAAEGEKLCEGKMLLCTLGCGQFVGGGYRSSPRSSNTDGQMEICLVKPLPRLKLLRLMSLYKKGLHLEEPSLKNLITYRRAQHARIRFPRETGILLDGEIIMVKETDVRILPRALSFLVPRGL